LRQNTTTFAGIRVEPRYGKMIKETGVLDTSMKPVGHLIWYIKVKMNYGQKMQRRTMYLKSDSEMKLDDIEKVHPMKQVFVMSIVQIVVLGFMGLSMYLIGVAFG
jgi:hypothetical protein